METGYRAKYMDTVFLMTVGVFLAWSLVSAVISTTIFSHNHLAHFLRILFVIGLLRVLVSHKYLVWATALFVLSALAFIGFGFFSTPETPSLANEAADFFRGLAQFLSGMTYHTDSYERFMVWALCISIGLFVVVFTYVRFQFFVIFALSAGMFSVLLTSRVFSFHLGFVVFVICIFAYLIRYLTGRRGKRSETGLNISVYALPLAILCIGLGAFLPTPPDGFAHNLVQTGAGTTLQRANDIISSFSRPNYFSLRQTGFGDAGGRLGGDVFPNDGAFMRIRAGDSPQPIYLAGRILDTYTGYAWISSQEDRWSLDFHSREHNLALYERAVSGETAFLTVHMNQGLYVSVFQEFWDWDFVDAFIEEMLQTYVGRDAAEGGFWLSMVDDWTIQVGFGECGETHTFDLPPGEGWAFREVAYPFQAALTIDLDDETYWTRRVDVGILDHRTHSLFSTGLLERIVPFNVELYLEQDQNGNISSRELMPRNTWYKIYYNELSESPPFDEMEKYQWLRREEWWRGAPADTRWFRGGDLWEEDRFPNNWMLLYSYRGVLRDISERIHAFYENHDQHAVVFRGDDANFFQEYRGLGLAPIILRHNGQSLTYRELLDNYLIPRADWIYETYTTLPEEFPGRIRDLALEITAGAQNDYERARLIETHLSTQYYYTMTPGMPPEDRDFVDYFLFDSQMGYCTYFASAFVTMVRSIGLPARYVEGFVAHGELDGEGFITVLNRMVHAWGEVYFEGYGWVQFEPTPAVGLPLPSLLPPVEEAGSALDLLEWDEWERQWLLEQYLMAGFAEREAAELAAAQGQGAEGEAESRIRDGVWSEMVLLAFIALAVFGFAALICRALWVYSRNAKARKQENGPAVIHYFDVLLKYMKFFNFEMRETETVVQFTERVAMNFGFPNETFFPREIADTFGRARYSQHPISREERRLMETAVHKIDATMQSYTGKIRYLVYKYILAIV